jgi:hypothetical protein
VKQVLHLPSGDALTLSFAPFQKDEGAVVTILTAAFTATASMVLPSAPSHSTVYLRVCKSCNCAQQVLKHPSCKSAVLGEMEVNRERGRVGGMAE